jgi:hypothetical protein
MTFRNLRLSKLILNLVLFIGFSPIAMAAVITVVKTAPLPIALVWQGPGACWPDCWPEAASAAKNAGFQVIYMTPQTTDYSIFNTAKIWVQPGGTSETASIAMGQALRDRIRQFVADGGGYVGFCAGMFLASEMVGTTNQPGIGLIPGATKLYKTDGTNDHAIYLITLTEGTRYMYYAGGPYLDLTGVDQSAQPIQIMGYYPNGAIATIHTQFGKGRVAVSGFHPEIGDFYKRVQGFTDPDGGDEFYAQAMMKYAAGMAE